MTSLELSTQTRGLAIANSDLSGLVARWLVSFDSPRTREAYRANLERFALFLETHRMSSLLEVSRAEVDLFARSLESAGYSNATRAQWLASLSSFYEYAIGAGAIESNPAAKVKRPKLPKYSPRLGLNLDTAPKVLEAARELTAEHRALVALCFLTGLRVSEALEVSASAITENAGHRVLSVRGKGGSVEQVPLSPPALRLLSEVLDKNPIGPLLPGIDRFAARRMVAAIGRKAELGYKLSSHDLRHGAVTCALEAGESLDRVREFARHADPRTTQRYDHSRKRLDHSAAYGLARALGGDA